MYELTVTKLKQTEVLVFRHNESGVATLLRLLADYCEASSATLLSTHFTNDDEDGYSECLTATVECAWQQ